MVRKKPVILDCLRPRKLSPRLGESTIFGFWPCAEKAPFGSCFGPSFWSVCELHAQKTRFQWVSENCFISEWIFEAFWVPQNRVKINKNSILGVILGQDGSKEVSSWANMAPRTDFHRFCIDFSMILEWISQVYFDRYCDEVESEFGFVLPRGRKDAKLRSSEGMKARSRAQNGIRSHIRGSCSRSLCSLTLHSVAHRSALPCSVHGYARVHTSIYIYIYIYMGVSLLLWCCTLLCSALLRAWICTDSHSYIYYYMLY